MNANHAKICSKRHRFVLVGIYSILVQILEKLELRQIREGNHYVKCNKKVLKLAHFYFKMFEELIETVHLLKIKHIQRFPQFGVNFT